MKLLLTTQAVNKNDTNLGFFHEWIKRLAGKVKKLYVICLFEGEHDLPNNVKVISLGKEKGSVSRWVYAWRFRKAVKSLNKDFDSVFIHMNPEYAILGKIFGLWKGKKVLLWYMHKAVNWRLRWGGKFVTKIFTASKESCRLSSRKVEVVGHGIEILDNPAPKWVSDTLFLMSVGRITRSKNWESIIDAIKILNSRKIDSLKVTMLLFAGAPITTDDIAYKEQLEKNASELSAQFMTGLAFNSYTHEQMLNVYQNYQIFIHTSQTGSLDKVVLEALAAGRVVVTTSEAYKDLANGALKDVLFYCPPGEPLELAKTIEKIWQSGILKELPLQKAVDYVKKNHNLDNLVDKIVNYFSR